MSGNVDAANVVKKRGRPLRSTVGSKPPSLKEHKRQKKVKNQSANKDTDFVDKEGALNTLFSYTKSIIGANNNDTIVTPYHVNNYGREQSSTNLNSIEIDKFISDDNERPHAYLSTTTKASNVSVEDVKASKNIDFFDLIGLDRVPPLLYNQEYINILKWNDKSGKACTFDAKGISTTAWRHFRLSWHDYMNLVILTSPFRRDRLVLEKVKMLGPPRSINGLRRTFRLGDSRSRRIFFQIYYTPRISKKSGIALPGTLKIWKVDAYKQHLSLLSHIINQQNLGNNLGYRKAPHTLIDSRNNYGLQRPSIGINANTNVTLMNRVSNTTWPASAIISPSSYTHKVLGRPITISRDYKYDSTVIETVGYPIVYATDAAQVIARPQSRYL